MTSPQDHATFRGSSRVASATYHADVEIIEVVFVDGVHWNFYRCSRRTWNHFKYAGSAGKFVHEILERHPHSAA